MERSINVDTMEYNIVIIFQLEYLIEVSLSATGPELLWVEG